MYKIGEFSKLVDLPVKTLRYYDEIGLLCPKKIDDFTGYRYYDDGNVLEIEVIKLLKSVDFSLAEIIEHKDNLNEDVFDYKKEEILSKIKDLKVKYEKLEILKQNVTKNKNIRVLKKEE